jgi:hypothetical protein
MSAQKLGSREIVMFAQSTVDTPWLGGTSIREAE